MESLIKVGVMGWRRVMLTKTPLLLRMEDVKTSGGS